MMEQGAEETVLLAALSALSPPHLSHLSHSILSLTLLHHRRLSCLLSSASLFSLTLSHLHSLSLSQKTHLIARHLLSSLHYLTLHLLPPPPPPLSTTVTSRDLDAVLLLLLLCEIHRHHPDALSKPYAEWRVILRDLYSDTVLTLCGIDSTLITYVEMVTRCRRFVKVMRCEKREVAASPAAVVALPAVEVREVGVECVICKEEMKQGRDVCQMPCQHLFHWMCILPWLKKRNTCPCCRFQLPCDDVLGEIERLWNVLVKASGNNNNDNVNVECK